MNVDDKAQDSIAPPERSAALPFPVVGIGASAGGLEAFTELLRALPPDTGMAFVLVQHLAPTHASMLAEILARATVMPVAEVQGEPAVVANHVYVIPPGQDMTISHGVLRLAPRTAAAGRHRPIDGFFISLAADQAHRAIGVVLSGTANDGTIGLEEIKAAGGITFAQDASAQHGSMPQSAVAAGCVDVVLPPGRIAEELAHIARHPYVVPPRADGGLVPEETPADQSLAPIFRLLRKATNIDFTHYKASTLSRRIARRMVLHKQNAIADYTRLLQANPAEVDALNQDILIGVTSFFRDPEVFEALKAGVLAKLLKNRPRRGGVRVWVVGCSTGEEAYSIAMAYAECEEEAGVHVPLQVFASDLNATAIEKARAGVYPKSIANDVSPERLRRFFVETEGAYRVSKRLRDACVFACHNVLADPPFSHVDLISCRNVLIYLEPVLQRRILPTLHYALEPDGVLLLGNSETIGAFSELFDVLDGAHKLYTRKPGPGRLGLRLRTGDGHQPAPLWRDGGFERPRVAGRANADDLQKQADRLVLARYAPPGVVLNADWDILHVRGDTSPYLAPAQGRASLNLAKMAREGLMVPLRAALLRAEREKATVCESGVRITTDGVTREVTLEVTPVRGGSREERGFVVLFAEGSRRPLPTADAAAVAIARDPTSLESEVARLTRELAETREYLHSVIERYDAANEQLESSNEETQSANEELQSINEELETSKEEIQSSNEELATVNDELRNRNTELGRLSSDLTNLITSIEMSVIIVARDLCVRRFSPMAGQAMRLSASDVGRPIRDVRLSVDVPDLERLLAGVIDSARPVERDVRDTNGRWYSLRVRPYQTLENKIDGAVVVFVDVDLLKHAQEYAESIVETVRVPLVVVDRALRVVSANPAFYDTFQVDDGGTRSPPLPFHDVGEEPSDVPPLRALLEEVLPEHRTLTAFEVARDFPGIGRRVVLLNTRPLATSGPESERILVVIEDITERRKLEDGLRTVAADLAEADLRKNEFLAMLAHELRNPLGPIRNAAHLLERAGRDDEISGRATKMIGRQVNQMVRLVDDLLDVSRISRGTIELRRERIPVGPLVADAVEVARAFCDRTGQELNVSVSPEALYVNGDAARLTQVIDNLVVNACKFTDAGGHISVTVERDGSDVVIRVKDDGIGIEAAKLPRVFDMFMQVESSRGRSQSGLGIGLTLVKTLVELHGGTIQADSAGLGGGSEFVVRLPLVAPPAPERAPKAAGSTTATATAKRRILVVDDNCDAAESLAMLLALDGHSVEVAHTGLEGLRVAEQMHSEIIILDIGLPGMDGYEVARRVRAAPWGKGILLIGLSGWSRDEDRQRSAGAGFDVHMAKPADHDTLAEVIDAGPSHARASAAPAADSPRPS